MNALRVLFAQSSCSGSTISRVIIGTPARTDRISAALLLHSPSTQTNGEIRLPVTKYRAFVEALKVIVPPKQPNRRHENVYSQKNALLPCPQPEDRQRSSSHSVHPTCTPTSQGVYRGNCQLLPCHPLGRFLPVSSST